ncbi:MAG: hypothetical protein KDA22_06450 [Phycisphaerales bacterium]|nr:hypothetical protein [Phycisphaerales bacterium]
MSGCGTNRRRIRWVAIAALLAASVAHAADDSAARDPVATASRGLAAEHIIEYAGPPLRAKPDQGLAAPMLVRVTVLPESERRDAAGVRQYRIDYIGNVAGLFDLRELIQHQDGTPASDLDPLFVRIVSELPPQHGTDLFLQDRQPFLLESHYRLALVALAIAWFAVPAVVLVRRALRRPPAPVAVVAPPPPTLADQLRPLVEGAMRQGLSVAERGRLELLLLRYWQDRLALAALAPADAVVRMRTHPEAGRLLTAVERWLHARGASSPRAEDDVAELLEPYRTAPALSEASRREVGA